MPRRSFARSPARFLAPLALVAFAVACLVVVNSSGGHGGGSKTSTAPTGKQRASQKRTTTTGAARPRRTYVVRTGDNLSTIAERTGVPLVRLRQLNPTVDPQGLSPGQRLKLRP